MKGRGAGMGKAVAQYLARHAEPEAALAAGLPGEYGHALVVPAYGERESLFSLLGSVPRGPSGDVLVVLVLNARADSAAEIHEANDAVRLRLQRDLPAALPVGAAGNALSYPLEHGRLLLVDRAAPGQFLPAGQGVGLARKIGFDAVLALGAAGRIASPWIHSTDADTLLPRDYFDRAAASDAGGAGAAIYPFEHVFDPDPLLSEAGRLYEISLRYYVLGLAWAGSPYAYQSMGSCIAIPSAAYARVRGFPRRNALEDFYALNKLAKVGRILRLGGDPVLLEGRISERVPISTGKALAEMVSPAKKRAGFRLYHPAVFGHLAAWLRVLDATARSGGDLDGSLADLPESSPFFHAALLRGSLEKMGAFRAARSAIGRSKNEASLLERLHTWFDAFKTVKLVHALRDGGLASLDYSQALAEAPFTGLTHSTADHPEQLRQRLLAEERKLTDPVGLPTLSTP